MRERPSKWRGIISAYDAFAEYQVLNNKAYPIGHMQWERPRAVIVRRHRDYLAEAKAELDALFPADVE